MDETNLKELSVWLCDVQTSDASPARGQIIDVAWSVGSVAQGFEPTFSSLVALQSDGARLGRRITSLTGISTHMLAGAPSLQDIASALSLTWASPQTPLVSVAHYARYERPFFQDMMVDEPVDLGDFICTHAIARRVLPGLPRRGLRALAGYFGAHLSEHKRSEVHVMATRVIWEELTDLLADEHDVHTLGELHAFLKRPVPKGVARTFAFSREKRLAMPRTPGVYRMLGRQGEVLYVGKATSLKQRINSYFTGKKGEGERKLEMATQVWDVAITQVDTPLEAALLEAAEIKLYEPAYNQLLKSNDRKPWWVSGTHPWRISDVHDPAHFSLGPTSERDMFSAFAHMIKALSKGQLDVAGQVLYRLDDEQVFLQGLTMWREVRGVGEEMPAATWWWALGGELILEANARRVARRAARAAAAEQAALEDVLEEEHDEEEVDPWSWTPEAVQYGLDGIVRRTARHVFRGHLLRILSGATLTWKPSHGPMSGQLKVVEVPDYGPWSETTLEVLDSLRVLVTELKRLCGQPDSEVSVCLREGAYWGREELWQRLQLV